MKIRVLSVAFFALLVTIPSAASGQSADTAQPELDRFSLEVAAGPLLQNGGHTLSAAFGFAPLSRLEFLVSVERDHLPFERETFRDGFSLTRGGDLTTVSGEIRASVLPPHRVSPYGFAGIGGGISKPTVNSDFPEPVTNDLRVVYFGAGLRVPLRQGFAIFGDARAMLALENEGDSLMSVVPLRIGVAWRF